MATERLLRLEPEDEAKFIKLFLEAGGDERNIESLTGIDMRKYCVKWSCYEYGERVTVVNVLDMVKKQWDY